MSFPDQSARICFHALIIGIDTYREFSPPLRGAVADARRIKAYVQKHLCVPESRVVLLENDQATRDAIVKSIEDLAIRAEHNDAMLIYFAGHGSEITPPAGWNANNDKIQVLVAYDARYSEEDGKTSLVGVLPDRTLAALLHRLSDKKGNNITVMLDCCHSASGTRVPKAATPRRIRLPNNIQLFADCDADIWNTPGAGRRGAKFSSKFLNAGLRSHILLAACGAHEFAWEEPERGGVFTTALIQTLNAVGIDRITYAQVIDHVGELPRAQNPQCEGHYKNRTLFNSRIVHSGPAVHPIKRELDTSNGSTQTYSMRAGDIHGIRKGAEFAIYSSFVMDEVPLGFIHAKDVLPTWSRMAPLGTNSAYDLPVHAVALQTRAADASEEAFIVHIQDQPEPDCVVKAFQRASQDSSRRRILRSDAANAKIAIVQENVDGKDMIAFELLDPDITSLGLHRLYDRVHADPQQVYNVLRAAEQYYWHLDRPTNGKLRNHLDIHVYKLEEADDGELRPVQPLQDIVVDGDTMEVMVEQDAETLYGMEVINNSHGNIFMWILMFDNSNLEIASYYESRVARDGSRIDPPLRARSSFTVNYGGGGGDPMVFVLRPGQALDIGYLRIYLSTAPVDLSSIEQPSPFSSNARFASKFAALNPKVVLWDIKTLKVVQKSAG